jgi:hypothetical protein
MSTPLEKECKNEVIKNSDSMTKEIQKWIVSIFQPPEKKNTATSLAPLVPLGICTCYLTANDDGWLWADTTRNIRVEHTWSHNRYLYVPADVEETFLLPEHLAAALLSLHGYLTAVYTNYAKTVKNNAFSVREGESWTQFVKIYTDIRFKEWLTKGYEFSVDNSFGSKQQLSGPEIRSLLFNHRMMSQNNMFQLVFQFEFQENDVVQGFNAIFDEYSQVFLNERHLMDAQTSFRYASNYLSTWNKRFEIYSESFNAYNQFEPLIYEKKDVKQLLVSVKFSDSTPNVTVNLWSKLSKSPKQFVVSLSSPPFNQLNDIRQINIFQSIIALEYLRHMVKIILESPTPNSHPGGRTKFHHLTLASSKETEQLVKDLIATRAHSHADLLSKALQTQTHVERIFRLEIWKLRLEFDTNLILLCDEQTKQRLT